jgi:hypothetical protein
VPHSRYCGGMRCCRSSPWETRTVCRYQWTSPLRRAICGLSWMCAMHAAMQALMKWYCCPCPCPRRLDFKLHMAPLVQPATWHAANSLPDLEAMAPGCTACCAVVLLTVWQLACWGQQTQCCCSPWHISSKGSLLWQPRAVYHEAFKRCCCGGCQGCSTTHLHVAR